VRRGRSCLRLAGGVLLIASAPGVAAAQAWVPPAHTWSLAFVTQAIDHAAHVLDDGTVVPAGKSTTVGTDLIVGYAFTDRLSVSAGVPYVFAKYRGPGAPPPFIPFLPVDSCFCFHSDFQDLTGTVRYSVIHTSDGFAVTPSITAVIPSHSYDHVGEAVVGRDLREVHVGVDVGAPVAMISRRLIMQGAYAYSVVQRVLDIPNNRSNATLEGDYRLTRRLTVSGLLLWQRTHGGLRFPQEVAPFPNLIAEHDRLLRDNSLRLGGGVSYSWGQWDASVTYLGYTPSGNNTHVIHAVTVSLGWTHPN
jgi:hypothetical protein